MDDIPAGMIVSLNVDILEETSSRRGGFDMSLNIVCADANAVAHVIAAFA